MTESTILSIDFGTSNCKVILFNLEGKVLRFASRRIDFQSTDDESHEIDDRRFRWVLFDCIRQVVSEQPKKRVSAIGVTGQSTTTVFLDRKGKVERPIISHFDKRPDKYGRRLGQTFPRMSYSGLKIGASLMWLKFEEPESFKFVEAVCDVKEYIGFLLTGEMTHDYKALEKSCISELCESIDLEPKIFGKEHNHVLSIGTTRKGITELAEGIPVVVGPWDGLTGVVGSGLVREGLIADIAGTTEIVATPVSPVSKFGTRDHVIQNYRLYYSSFPFGLAYDWFTRLLYAGTKDQFATINNEVCNGPSAVGPDKPLFIPNLKEKWLDWKLKASLTNIDFRAQRYDIMQGIMEGIAMATKEFFHPFLKKESLIHEIRMSGGGAKNDVWNQIRADIFERPLVLLQTVETGCLGAAILASLSINKYSSIKEASVNMIKFAKEFRPLKENSERYRKRYSQFLASYRENKQN